MGLRFVAGRHGVRRGQHTASRTPLPTLPGRVRANHLGRAQEEDHPPRRWPRWRRRQTAGRHRQGDSGHQTGLGSHVRYPGVPLPPPAVRRVLGRQDGRLMVSGPVRRPGLVADEHERERRANVARHRRGRHRVDQLGRLRRSAQVRRGDQEGSGCPGVSARTRSTGSDSCGISRTGWKSGTS